MFVREGAWDQRVSDRVKWVDVLLPSLLLQHHLVAYRSISSTLPPAVIICRSSTRRLESSLSCR